MSDRNGGPAAPGSAGGPATRAGRRKAWMHAAFALAGAAAVAMLVRSVGVGALVTAMRASARWLPLLFAIEMGRVALEALATASLSERLRRRVSLPQLARVHVIAYAVSNIMPAGRATGETVKGAMLSRFLGAPEAAAIATGTQAAAMLSGAVAAIPCALVALALSSRSAFAALPGTPFASLLADPAALTAAIAVLLVFFALGSTFVVAAFQLACRRPEIGGALLRRFTKLEETSAAFQGAIQRIPLVPGWATAAGVGSRALFALELGVLLHAASGGGFGKALLTLGVSMVGGALGEVVPGQLGASDGAFALAAPALGITAADGVAMAMTLHVVQIAWALVAWTVPLLWKAAPVHADEAGGLPAES